mmetsp:Transcript_15245/g.27095  ORF Transcript_15245/g.27095 Transcript_15245/m.27095 type:complete len:1255 (-) Transcript_15245:391-4155(-)
MTFCMKRHGRNNYALGFIFPILFLCLYAMQPIFYSIRPAINSSFRATKKFFANPVPAVSKFTSNYSYNNSTDSGLFRHNASLPTVLANSSFGTRPVETSTMSSPGLHDMTISNDSAASDDHISFIEDNIIKPKNSLSQYRYLTLKNGLKVLLVHDPEAEKSAAAMDVGVGSMSDTSGYPGLAHFTEHMLFYSSDKYPDEGAYSKFISDHGGHTNAYTASERTNYQFDVNPEHLEGALDRFAQFFLCPQFSADGVQREVKAVDSEYSKNLNSDAWRRLQLSKHVSRPDHPASKFSTGNKDTLFTQPTARGESPREAVAGFYRDFYSSNRMALALVGPQPLKELQRLAVEKFADIANKDLPTISVPEDVYLPETQQGILLRFPPVRDGQKLELVWSLPPSTTPANYKKMPSSFLSALIGDEGSGSVFAQLKERGWASALSAGGGGRSGFSTVNVAVELTKEGDHHVKEVVEMIFQYISILRRPRTLLSGAKGEKKEGVSVDEQHKRVTEEHKRIWEEQRDLDLLRFHNKERISPYKVATNLADAEPYYPPSEILLISSHVKMEYDPDSIQDVLDLMTPDRVRCFWGSKEHAIQNGLIAEPGSDIKLDSDSTKKKVGGDGGSIEGEKELSSLPPPSSSSSSSSSSISSSPTTTTHRIAEAVFDEKRFALVKEAFTREAANVIFQQPYSWGTYRRELALSPRRWSIEEFSAVLPSITSSDVRQFVRHSLLRRGAVEGLLAGNVNFDDVERLREIINRRVVKPNYQVVVVSGEGGGEGVKMDNGASSISPSKSTSMSSTESDCHRPTREMVLISPDIVRHSAVLRVPSTAEVRALLSDSDEAAREETNVGGGVEGAMDKAKACEGVKALKGKEDGSSEDKDGNGGDGNSGDGNGASSLSSSSSSSSHTLLASKNVSLKYPHVLLEERGPNPKDDNSALVQLYQIGPDELKTNVLSQLLVHLAKRDAFHELRTQQQLGYIVSMHRGSEMGVKRVEFIVQSSTHSVQELADSVDAFVASLLNKGLPEKCGLSPSSAAPVSSPPTVPAPTATPLPKSEFQVAVEELAKSKLEKAKQLGELAGQWWTEISSGSFLFDRQKQEVEVLRRITPEELLAFAKDVLGGGGGARKLAIRVVGSAEEKRERERESKAKAAAAGTKTEGQAKEKSVDESLAESENGNGTNATESSSLLSSSPAPYCISNNDNGRNQSNQNNLKLENLHDWRIQVEQWPSSRGLWALRRRQAKNEDKDKKKCSGANGVNGL